VWGGGWRFKGRLVGALLLKRFDRSILALFKAKCIKIAILFLNISLFSMKMNTFFKIEVPINLYHTERHISPSEAVLEAKKQCTSDTTINVF